MLPTSAVNYDKFHLLASKKILRTTKLCTVTGCTHLLIVEHILLAANANRLKHIGCSPEECDPFSFVAALLLEARLVRWGLTSGWCRVGKHEASHQTRQITRNPPLNLSTTCSYLIGIAINVFVTVAGNRHTAANQPHLRKKAWLSFPFLDDTEVSEGILLTARRITVEFSAAIRRQPTQVTV